MLVVVVAVGSRGDVQPYVALGAELARGGLRVRLASGASFKGLVERAGLEHVAVAHSDPQAVLASERGQAWVGSRDPVAFVRRLVRLGKPEMEGYVASVTAACDGADAVVYSPLGAPAFNVAQARGVPAVLAQLQPVFPTREFPSFTVPGGRSLGPVGNRLSHMLLEQVGWQLMRRPVDRWRRQLGLAPLGLAGPWPLLRRGPDPILYGYSPTVLPRPADWPAHLQVTGYWFLDPEPGWAPPPELEAFLAAGPPPVYVGFGSMVWPDHTAAWRTVLAAVRQAGVRAVVAGAPPGLASTRPGSPAASTEPAASAEPAALPRSAAAGPAHPPGSGRDDLHALGDDLYFLGGEVPHAWLFPRTAAVVHHAGAGTTAAGLRAGVPAVTCPFFADQPLWAGRVHALGAGPAPIRARLLTAARLAAAIRQAVAEPRLAGRAAALGERIRAEHGTRRAAAIITSHLDRSTHD